MELRYFLVTAIILPLCAMAGFYAYMEEQGHFCAITHGEAYRSGQLDIDELRYYIGKYNLKSILNLRGRNPSKLWYRKEVKLSSRYQIKHYDIALSKSHWPDSRDVHNLIEIFKTAPRPILIHCAGGSDRSGLAAAMWKVIVDGEPKSEARKQLSIWYGHLPVFGASAMDNFFSYWRPAGPVYTNEVVS